MEVVSLIIPLKIVESLSLIETQELLARRTNGRATSWVTIGSAGHKYGLRFVPEKKLRSCGQYGIQLLLSTNGGPAYCASFNLQAMRFLPP